MKLYLTKMCESLIGTLDFRTGYHIHAFRGGLCIRRNAKGSAFNAVTRTITPVLRKVGLYTLAVRVLSVVKSGGKGRR